MTGPGLSFARRVTRGAVLKTIGSGAVMLGAADLLAACGEIKGSSTATSGTITIGYVSPQTGALAGFATGDNWVLGGVRQTDPYKNGFKLGSKTYSVNIVVKDTQSNPDRASQVARELIQSNKADLILTSSTPETTNPVADVCEANGVPCVSTIVPWEAWFVARGGKPGPDFNTMWKQAAQQGFKPKLATVAKVLLFPADTEALGDLVNNVATDAWWTPFHPYHSTLTGQSCKQFADSFESATGKRWVQSIGSVHSLFEIAHTAFAEADDPRNRTAVATQLKTMNYTGISGPLDFTKGPMPGIAIQKPVGVQWKKGSKFPYSMVVVDNSANKNVPVNGDLVPTNP